MRRCYGLDVNNEPQASRTESETPDPITDTCIRPQDNSCSLTQCSLTRSYAHPASPKDFIIMLSRWGRVIVLSVPWWMQTPANQICLKVLNEYRVPGVPHGYQDTNGYFISGSIADTGYFGFHSITHTIVCVILAKKQYHISIHGYSASQPVFAY